MGMKPRFKQTEVGNIPEDWDVRALGELSRIERGKFTARPRNDPRFYGGDTPFIQTGDVSSSNGLIRSFTQTLNAEGLKVSKMFPKGTLFFTIAANIGDIGFTEFDTACPDSLVAITPDKTTDVRWLAFELARRKKSFENLATHNAQLNINLAKLRPYQLPVPPLSEQRAIAEALSDADALIESLDQLIAKKRDIKQAAMQQLLTGQRRLPGFCREWELRKLGDVVEIRKGELITENHSIPGSIPVVAGGKKPAYFHNKPNRTGSTITISGSGASAGFVAIYREPIFASDCSTIGEGETYSLEFIYFVLTWRQAALYRAQTGGAQPHVHPNDIRPIAIPVPKIPEQVAIAEVLSDMDSELAALEKRRDKIRALKQGMMQELLTGRTRLT